MLDVLGGPSQHHDLILVCWAVVIGALASIATITLLGHARPLSGRAQGTWLALAALAGGSGIWATHFFTMLAVEPDLPCGYLLTDGTASLAIAIVTTFAGLALSLRPMRSAGALGGMLVGAGIAAMHYVGMRGFVVAGQLRWDLRLVAVSIAIAIVLASLAVASAVRRRGVAAELSAGGLLLLAIVGQHFTGLTAVTIVPDAAATLPAGAVSSGWVALAVLAVTTTVLLLAGAALIMDLQVRRKGAQEAERTRSLVNATAEGLLITDGERIVDANDNLVELVGLPLAQLTGRRLGELLPGAVPRDAIAQRTSRPVESELRTAAGTMLPVELIVRPVIFSQRPCVAVAVRDISARRDAEKQIHYLAHHDALTGLFNRESFNRRLDASLELARVSGRKIAVLCLDLDRFKEVNDLFGHPAGDAVLQTVANVLTGAMGDEQIVARMGGDEFAVMSAVDHAGAAGALADTILDAMRDANTAAQGPLLATSIGIAIYPTDAEDRETLLSQADTALYRAKGEGRNTARFFEAAMGAQVRDRRLLEHDLRRAIARGELRVVYQPQRDIRTGEVFGFEALLRWTHPVRGTVSPDLFIPLAEETGLIGTIGEWVLRETCKEAATWQQPLIVAVNVSAVQMHDVQLPRLIQDILLETGLPPSRLELEITETALIRDPARALSTLRQLKVLGIRIAMDDFGTGYSSLSNLRMFPFDKLKIDRSFISGVDASEQTAAIVRSVLGLGRGLGIPVLAEGVETEEEMRFLQDENCHSAQGYLISRPLGIDAFQSLVRSEPEDDAGVAA